MWILHRSDKTQMRPRRRHCYSSAWRACYKPLLDEKRLIDVFDGFSLFTHADGKSGKTNGSAVELIANCAKHRSVHFVKTKVIYSEYGQRFARRGFIHFPITSDLSKVANATQQSVRDAWGATRPAGYFCSTLIVNGDIQNSGSTANNALQLFVVVVIESGNKTEAITQRSGNHSRTRGGTDQSKSWKRQSN